MLLEVNGNNINHHKLLQYLAQGKPVLAPQFKDYDNNKLVYTYINNEHGIAYLDKILKEQETENIIAERIQFAQHYTYEKLIQKVEAFLSKEN